MKRRMYFVLPNCVAAKETENDLLLAKIDNHNIHFMAHESVDLGDLNRANFLQRSDLIHGWEMGLVVGGLTGALLGMTLLQFGVFASMGLGAVLLIALAGAFMGAWFSGLVAISVPNSRLKPFEPIKRPRTSRASTSDVSSLPYAWATNPVVPIRKKPNNQ